MRLPECGNYLSKTCPRSDVYVEGERNGCYVLRCRTCKTVNIWPSDPSDNRGRYEGFLKQQADAAARERATAREREYSFGGQ